MIGHYLGAVSSAVGQGVLTGVWVAAGALSPGRRRAVRVGATAAVAAVGWVGRSREQQARALRGEPVVELDPATFRDLRAERDRPGAPPEEAGASRADRRRLALLGVTVVGSLGMMIGQRRLEKRWLARLERNGHAHPYRALALRMGALAVAAALPGQLMEAHEKRNRTD